MAQIPPNLPDERTAQRLLDTLAQLEARVSSATSIGGGARVEELEQQVSQLKHRQQQAKTRLEALADKLESTIAATAEAEEAAA